MLCSFSVDPYNILLLNPQTTQLLRWITHIIIFTEITKIGLEGRYLSTCCSVVVLIDL